MTEIIKAREITIHKSKIDQSVNITYPAPNIGIFETRYVRREDEYFIIYLSSQSGCDQACKMCHLTATGQNKYENATLEEYLHQAKKSMNITMYKTKPNLFTITTWLVVKHLIMN